MSADRTVAALHRDIAACRVCKATLGFTPRPVAQFSATSRILIVGQAPGSKVHASGVPWDDASGARLCEWTGLTPEQLHDPALVAIVPMGFCYPGKASGGDKPPRPECAPLWHERVLATLPTDRLTLLVGTYAQKRYLPETRNETMADRIGRWHRDDGRDRSDTIPLPHPSWRSTMFMRKHPWFEAEMLPEVRKRIGRMLA